MSEYLKQAKNFLEKCGIIMGVEFLRNGKYFDDDKDSRDIYKITLRKNRWSWSFEFGQSIDKSGNYFTQGKMKTEIPDEFRQKDRGFIERYVRSRTFFNDRTDKLFIAEAPDEYDVLACITKYSPGTFENFCSDFGYDTDSKKAEKIYNAVVQEWLKVSELFTNEELEELREIY